MSIHLDKRALDNIKNYKYQTHGLTFIEKLIMDPFWNLCCKYLPRVNLFFSPCKDPRSEHDDDLRSGLPPALTRRTHRI